MLNYLRHLFLPRESNNYRAGFLHNNFLLTLIFFLFSMGVFVFSVKTNYPSVLGISSDISIQQLLILTNQQRQNNNLGPLTDNSELDQAAANKATDMFSKDYWAHNAPDGTTPWVFIKGAGYNYIYAGENLARGFTNASDVISAWMNSPEHRANVLSPNYQNVGFAVATGKLTGEDTVLVVEMLGSSALVANVPSGENNPVTAAVASGSPAVINTAQPNVTPVVKQVFASVPKTELLGASAFASVKPLIDSLKLAAMSTQFILALFILVLLLDMIVVDRKKVVRFVGHNLDHLLFFIALFLIVIVLARGSIL
jgi:hypothetical protein